MLALVYPPNRSSICLNSPELMILSLSLHVLAAIDRNVGASNECRFF
jgi:hypothetical protein